MFDKKYAFEIVFLPFMFITLTVVSWICGFNALAFACAIFGLLGCVINGIGKKYCYIFSLISSILYAIVSYQQGYWGEVILHIVFICPLYVYSLIKWYKPNDKEKMNNDDIYSLNKKYYINIAVVYIVVSVVYGLILNVIKTNLPFLNALSTVTLLLANYYSAKRIKQFWYFHMFGNIILIALWLTASQNDISTLVILVENILFFISNVRGAVLWNKKNKAK